MDNKTIEELAMAVALKDYCEEVIEKNKKLLRSMTKDEIDKINKTKMLIINRSTKTTSTYPKEYEDEVEKLKLKYTKTTTSIPNYNIKLITTSYTDNRKDLIVNKILTMNQSELNKILKQNK